MSVFIALYRGINVGGKNPVKMESLRAMHERLGHQQVQSYIQSGNIVFTANGSAHEIAQSVATEFAHEFGFAARVVVVSARSLGDMIAANPYARAAAENPRAVHAGFCTGQPSQKGLAELLTKTKGTESFAIGKGIVFLHAPDGLGKSKFAAGMEKASGVPMTVRNWRSIEALWKLATALT